VRRPRILSSGVFLAVLSLLAAELLLRWLFSLDPILYRIPHGSDSAWRIQWLARHPGRGSDALFLFDRYDPLRGWAVKSDLKRVRVFNDRFLSSDHLGIRGEREYVLGSRGKKPRVLVFGDSYAFGEEVSDDQTFSAQLEKLSPGLEVINMGVHGYGYDQSLIYFEQVGRSLHPDLVVLVVNDADTRRGLLGFRDYAKPHFKLSGESLVLSGSPVPDVAETLAQSPFRPRLLDLGAMAFEMFRWKTGINQQRAETLTSALLDRWRQETRRTGAKLILLHLPTSDELALPAAEPVEAAFYREYCQRTRSDCHFLFGDFQQAIMNGEHFKTEGHWLENGHRLVARALAKWIHTP
jgi:hypothetical protein